MRYFFISDVHGQYQKMKQALEDASFDKDNDTLVSLGDLFDRGPASKEVLEFVMSCPHRILVGGNHDSRLRELLLGHEYTSADISNGVPQTLRSFCCSNSFSSLNAGLLVFSTDQQYKDTYNLLWRYFNELVDAVEFSDLIGTHGWIPRLLNWEAATQEEWCDASWANTAKQIYKGNFPSKNMIVGHWWAWLIAAQYEKRYKEEDYQAFIKETDIKKICGFKVKCDTFILKTFRNTTITLIDGCTNLDNGKVNVVIKETEETPLLIKGVKNGTI